MADTMVRADQIGTIINKLKELKKNGKKLSEDFILNAFKDIELTDAESESIFREFAADFDEFEDNNSLIENYEDTKDTGSFKLFLNRIGTIPLLSAQEETELALKIEEGKKAEKKNEDITELINDPQTDKETQDYLKVQLEENNKIIEKAEEASNELVIHNIRLVVSIAKHYVGTSMTIEDVVQEGSIGLKRATESFDHTKGYKFSTYATWWIKQSITRGLAQQDRMIRLPVHIVENVNKVRKAQQRLLISLSRDPSVKEIARETEMDEQHVEDTLKYMSEPASLDTPIGEDGDMTLGDFMVDAADKGPQAIVINNQMYDAIQDMLEILTERERYVIIKRFGLFGNERQSLEQLGSRFNLTRERIRQIEFKALQKLRHKNNIIHMKEFIYDNER